MESTLPSSAQGNRAQGSVGIPGLGQGGCSGEVHGPQGVVVDLDRLGQRLRVPAVALTRDMAALSTIRTKTHTQHTWRQALCIIEQTETINVFEYPMQRSLINICESLL
jgi:hypothetical protein